jgi:hypothetical protein
MAWRVLLRPNLPYKSRIDPAKAVRPRHAAELSRSAAERAEEPGELCGSAEVAHCCRAAAAWPPCHCPGRISSPVLGSDGGQTQ